MKGGMKRDIGIITIEHLSEINFNLKQQSEIADPT